MKNIHILPTDKPTWLHKSLLTNILRKSSSCINNMRQAQGMNIYITNDEEIKEGDYYIDFTSNGIKIEHFKTKDDWVLVGICGSKKIILTTDQDLIADGVQAIDDEFLEWFVKNPNCEKVEVNEWKVSPLVDDKIFGYKIIIPKEEPKQETLEEFIERASSECDIIHFCKHEFERFIKLGAKWQQQQNKNLYSEEEMIDIFFLGRDTLDKALITKDEALILIKQFKKK